MSVIELIINSHAGGWFPWRPKAVESILWDTFSQNRLHILRHTQCDFYNFCWYQNLRIKFLALKKNSRRPVLTLNECYVNISWSIKSRHKTYYNFSQNRSNLVISLNCGPHNTTSSFELNFNSHAFGVQFCLRGWSFGYISPNSDHFLNFDREWPWISL